MKLKYDFVIHEIDGVPTAVVVGKGYVEFNGMVRLNKTGRYIFELLENDISEENIIQSIMERYAVSKEQATQDVSAFLVYMDENGLIEK